MDINKIKNIIFGAAQEQHRHNKKQMPRRMFLRGAIGICYPNNLMERMLPTLYLQVGRFRNISICKAQKPMINAQVSDRPLNSWQNKTWIEQQVGMGRTTTCRTCSAAAFRFGSHQPPRRLLRIRLSICLMRHIRAFAGAFSGMSWK